MKALVSRPGGRATSLAYSGLVGVTILPRWKEIKRAVVPPTSVTEKKRERVEITKFFALSTQITDR